MKSQTSSVKITFVYLHSEYLYVDIFEFYDGEVLQ